MRAATEGGLMGAQEEMANAPFPSPSALPSLCPNIPHWPKHEEGRTLQLRASLPCTPGSWAALLRALSLLRLHRQCNRCLWEFPSSCTPGRLGSEHFAYS